VIPFDITTVLMNTNDILLKREDSVYISSIFELKDQYNVMIQGEVRHPGSYRYIDGLSIKDLILQSGGFTDAAYPQRIEIARVIKRDTLTTQDVRLSEIINIRDMNDLSYSSKNIILQPFDVITVRKLPGYLELRSVYITGQVQYPGPYVLANRAERISDLLKRAGGLAPEAYANGAYLKRLNEKNTSSEFDTLKVKKIQRTLKDTSNELTSSLSRQYDQIPLDLEEIIHNPGTDADLLLKAGDELVIPRNDQGVKVSGEVLSPTQAPYNKFNDLREYINEAGGFTDNARKNKIYVLYPNGRAAITKHFLLFRSYPKIMPGTEIIIPKESERTKKSTAETVGIASAIASLAGVVIAIIQLTK
jgi:protein involved in polysaccharide export with SLBB domain